MIEQVDATHFRLHGQVTIRDSAGLLQELFSQLPAKATQGQLLCLDVSTLESADSVLLAAILEVARRLETAGARLKLAGLPASLAGLARAYGVDQLIDAYR